MNLNIMKHYLLPVTFKVHLDHFHSSLCKPRKSKYQTLPLGSGESFTWIILKTILCLVLDFQGKFKQLSGWWFQIFFIFTPKIGEDEPILTNIFQMG